MCGLDNGIIIKKITKEQIESIPPYIETDITEYNNEIQIEVAYWRKCWGIRNEIITQLDMNDYTYTKILKKEDINIIIKILYKFLSKEYWEEYGYSIWEYDEIKEKLVQDIINLKWLYYFIQENDNIKIEFYDSY